MRATAFSALLCPINFCVVNGKNKVEKIEKRLNFILFYGSVSEGLGSTEFTNSIG